MQNGDGRHRPRGHAILLVQADVALVKQGIETMRFSRVAGGVFAQGVVYIKLPCPFGKCVFWRFTADAGEQILVSLQEGGGQGEKGFINGRVLPFVPLRGGDGLD